MPKHWQYKQLLKWTFLQADRRPASVSGGCQRGATFIRAAAVDAGDSENLAVLLFLQHTLQSFEA